MDYDDFFFKKIDLAGKIGKLIAGLEKQDSKLLDCKIQIQEARDELTEIKTELFNLMNEFKLKKGDLKCSLS